MNWDAIGAIAELLGAVVVVATVAYLARQIHQNTLAVQGQSDMDFTRQFVEWISRQTSDPELGMIWLRAVNKEPLTKAENLRFLFLMTEWVNLADGCYRQYKRGLMPSDMFEDTIVDGLLAYFQIEIFREWWDSKRALLSPGFREYINDRRNKETVFAIENDSFDQILSKLSKSD